MPPKDGKKNNSRATAQHAVYFDMNVRARATRDRERQLIVKRALELGWDAICWSTAITGKLTAQCKPAPAVELDVMKRREALQQRALVDFAMPLTVGESSNGSISSSSSSRSSSSDSNSARLPALRQLSRLSVTLDEVADAQSLTIGNEVVRQFDVISACPGNAKVFAFLCKTADVDIISLDLSRRLPFSLNKKLVDEAVARGVSFELCYSALLGASGPRREMMSSSRTLVQYLRGRSLVLSSGADAAGLLRGPADVANMAVVLGLSAENAERTVALNAALVARHAVRRKLRYLPSELVTATEFRRRWPEIALKDPPAEPPSKKGKKRGREEEEEVVGEELGLGDGGMEGGEDDVEGDGGEQREAEAFVPEKGTIGVADSNGFLAF